MKSALLISDREMDSVIVSLMALMDEVDDIRMSLNPQDEARSKLDRSLFELQKILRALYVQRDALRRVKVGMIERVAAAYVRKFRIRKSTSWHE